jgi:hypothetical protein
MLTRDELLQRLCEPYADLTAEERSQAEAMSSADAEIAEALTLCRTLAGLKAETVFGEPASGDAEFLIALREKIERHTQHQAARPLFGSRRLVAAVATACMALLVGIFGSSYWLARPPIFTEQTAANFAEAIEPMEVLDADSLADSDVSADTLAAYLNVTDYVALWPDDTQTDEPLSDLMLSLDAESFEEVLNKIEATNFF